VIGKEVTHIALGRTGGGIARYILRDMLSGKMRWLDTRTHLPLRYARSHHPDAGPSFSFIRNPFDWYISWYFSELEIHRWRGGFEDWFYNREGIPYQSLDPHAGEKRGMWMWNQWLYMTETKKGEGCAVDYVGRFENYLEDLVFILAAIIPDRVSAKEIRAWFPKACGKARGVSGVEQWFRDEMYTDRMVDDIREQDAPIFEKYGYTFEERYFHAGGCGKSCHLGIGDIGWKRERVLSEHWRTFDSLE